MASITVKLKKTLTAEALIFLLPFLLLLSISFIKFTTYSNNVKDLSVKMYSLFAPAFSKIVAIQACPMFVS